jgi:hypothetical protein
MDKQWSFNTLPTSRSSKYSKLVTNGFGTNYSLYKNSTSSHNLPGGFNLDVAQTLFNSTSKSIFFS